MSDAPDPSPEQPAPRAEFDPNAEHQQNPRIRKIRAVPVPAKGPDGEEMVMLGLADAQQIATRMVVTHPAFQQVLALMDGSRSVDQIVSEVGHGLERPMLGQFVAQLDEAGLIYGPKFDAMAAKMRSEFDNAEILPPGSTAQAADQLVMHEHGQDASDELKAEKGPETLRRSFDQWIDRALTDAENPAFDALPKAIVAPHLDYARGWLNYANIYGRLRVTERPDRVVILGTNHFGQATGVCGCDKGYETPLGVCEVDHVLVEAVRKELGDTDATKLFADRYDHENEHSVELHIPWIQHIFGQDDAGHHPKVFAALIHDPLVNNGEAYDDEGLALDPFVEALKRALNTMEGTTLIVASADLSHVGPAFGDQQPMAGDDDEAQQRRTEVAKHDQESLKAFTERRLDDMIGSMSWQQNPTRWCSVGNMTAAMRVAEPERVEMLNYAAAVDPQGAAFVSSAAIAMF